MPQRHPITNPAYVYRLWDKDGRLLYVGMSLVSAHRRIGQHLSLKWWGGQIARAEIVRYWRAADARAAETEAIRTEHPRWNIDGKGQTVAERDAWTEDDWRDHLVNLYRTRTPDGKRSGHYAPAAAEFEQRFRRRIKPRMGPRHHIGEPTEWVEIPPVIAADVVAAGIDEDGS